MVQVISLWCKIFYPKTLVKSFGVVYVYCRYSVFDRAREGVRALCFDGASGACLKGRFA